MTPRPKAEPRLELLEMCWRVVGSSQRVIECGIYRTDIGLDVRVGYSIEDLLRSQFATRSPPRARSRRRGSRPRSRRASLR
jgi:hypothetical protein